MRKFKKFLSSVLVVSMTVSLFVGLGSKEVEAAVARNNHGDSGLVMKAGAQITPSFDGSKLVYWSSNGDGPLQYYDVASKTAKSFSTAAGQRNKGVAFSKDGSKVVWTRGSKIDTASTDQAVYIYDTATGVEEKISGTDKVLGWPTITPDASKVAYLAKDGSTSGLIKVYDVSAKTLEVLNLPAGSHNPVNSMHPQQHTTLLYTGDGSSLLISYTTNTANRMQAIGTYKYDVNAGTFDTILTPSSKYYSSSSNKGGQGIISTNSDGSKFIEYVNNTVSEGAGLYLVDSASANRVRLTQEEMFPQYAAGTLTEDAKYAILPNVKGIMATDTLEVVDPELSMGFYKFYGLSGDGQKLFSLTGTSALDLVEYSFPSLTNGTSFIAPTSGTTITASVPGDFETGKIEWTPNQTTTEFDLYIDGKLSTTFFTKNVSPTPNGTITYNLLSYPYSGSIDLKIVEKNSSGSVESNTFTLNVVDLPAKLGNLDTYATAYVDFMGQKWSLVGDNYLLKVNPLSTSTPFDKGGSGIYDPLKADNIGSYLKAWFEGNATPEEQAMVSLHTWTVPQHTNLSNSYTVRSKIGMLTSHEANALRAGKVLNTTGSSSVWLMNTYGGNGYNTMTMSKSGNLINTSNANANATYVSTLPSLHLEPTVSVSGGDGSFTNPFTLNTVPTQPQVPAVTNLVGVSNSKENASLSWTAVPNATEYVVKRDGVVVGNPTTNSFSENGLTADTSYGYSVHAKIGATEGNAASVTVKTQPDIPQVTNIKLEELRFGHVKISFDPVSGATNYALKRNGSNIGSVYETYFEHNGPMVVGTDYTYEIRAIVNGVHGPAGSITVTAPEKVPTPQNFVGVSDSPTSNKLSWDPVANATEYRLLQDGALFIRKELSTQTGTSFDHTGLTPNTPYNYYLQAKIGDVYSDPVIITVRTMDSIPLTAPQDFKVTGKTDKTVSLSWTPVPGATGYEIKDVATGAVLYDGGTVTVATISGLNPSTDYTFEIVAKDGSAQTSPSSSVSITTSSEVIPYPAGFTVTKVTYDQVDLIWELVPNVDSYTVYRDGVALDTIDYTFYTDNTVTESTKYIYSVVANKGGQSSQPALKEVNTPARPIDGQAPGMPTGLKVVRAYADKVKLQWDMVLDASEYEVYRNGTNLVYKGPLTVLTDDTTGPEETYAYLVVAVNQFGKTAGAPVSVTTPAEAPQIIITPSPAPAEGTITFKFNVVEGAYEYHVERNPHWVYTANGDGTFHKTYENTATGEVRDYGNVTPEDGKLPFYEEGVAAGQNYTYEITAVRMAADGTPEVVGGGEVSVDTPNDGSGVTVPDPNGNGGGTTPPTNPGDGGTNPGDGGGTTPPTNPGDGGNNGGGTTPGTGGGSTTPPSDGNGGTTTPPTEGNGGTTTPPTTGEDGKGTGEEGSKGDSGNTSSEPVEFKDVEENHFASDAIKELSSKGIITGYTDGSFAPNKTVTRAEFAIMLKRALGLEEVGEYTNTFKDFKQTSWYAQELTVALSNGITKGFTDNTYRPNEIIPREQAAIMVSNVLREKGLQYEGTSLKFKDSTDIISWAVEDVKFAAEKGIIKGYSNGKFLPKANITRAETAVMIQRLLSLITD
ncbi:S-layer homology domain-containing protein [Paenibacillus sp. Dod16]|uniref:S-layer homology domain-containing protein n=1 Tax=Paenibacillus sp. Dod16 TaxID=3416392 RepID=UPI003CEAFA2C